MKNTDKSILFIALLLFVNSANAQSDGTFEITQSVVASGGGQNSAGGQFSLHVTTGQSAAGNALNGSPFVVTSGFWNFTPFAPSAASVTIGGRVRTANGYGIRNVRVSLTAPDGETRFVLSSSFGYYRFDDVAAGETYIISVTSKRYQFAPQVVMVSDDLTGVDFIPSP